MPFGSFGPKAIVKMRSRGIAGRMRHVIRPDSSSHQPEVKCADRIGEDRHAHARDRQASPTGVAAAPSSPALAVWRSAAPMTTSETSSPTVAERPE